MNKEKIFYADHIADFLDRPVLASSNLEQLRKEKVDIQHWTEVLCTNWHKFRDRWPHLFLGLLGKKSWASLLTSKLLFSECSSVSDSVGIFLGLVCDSLLTKQKQGKRFQELLKKVLVKIWHVIEADAYSIKSITLLDTDGLCIWQTKVKIGDCALVFLPTILDKKEEEATKTILHEVAHTLQPGELKMDREQFACDLAEQLVAETDIREGT